MARFTPWLTQELGTREAHYIAELEQQQTDRQLLVWRVQHDLLEAASTLGQTELQAETKIDELFGTFAADWAIFILAGSTIIADAVQNDVTLAWLDTVYPTGSGVTIRTRIVNRLNNG